MKKMLVDLNLVFDRDERRNSDWRMNTKSTIYLTERWIGVDPTENNSETFVGRRLKFSSIFNK